MYWVILVVSGMLEAVWASALSASNGFRRLWPSVLFVVSVVASMGGLAIAMSAIPTGTAYAVWVGIGATLTVVWALVTKKERLTAGGICFLALLVVSVIGLKVVS
ncbi:DMT family transporter [Leifsonia sp. Le1]|uniref:DMT family transporter n=1 Tax=Leifsonia sp. Le1 TaxID=3404918 RepID=UPI003EB6A410